MQVNGLSNLFPEAQAFFTLPAFQAGSRELSDARAYERQYSASIEEHHFELAREDVAADTDSYTDWLGAKCQHPAPFGWVPTQEHHFKDWLATAAEAQIERVSRNTGYSAVVRCGALDELTRRFLETQAARILEIAQGYANAEADDIDRGEA